MNLGTPVRWLLPVGVRCPPWADGRRRLRVSRGRVPLLGCRNRRLSVE